MKIRSLSESFGIVEGGVRVHQKNVSFLFMRAQATELLGVIASLIESSSLYPENRTLNASALFQTQPVPISHPFIQSCAIKPVSLDLGSAVS